MQDPLEIKGLRLWEVILGKKKKINVYNHVIVGSGVQILIINLVFKVPGCLGPEISTLINVQ